MKRRSVMAIIVGLAMAGVGGACASLGSGTATSAPSSGPVVREISETPAPPAATSPAPTEATPPASEEPVEPPAGAIDLAAIRAALEPAASGLDTPVGIANAGDGSGRLFIVEKRGVIRIVQGGALVETPFLDISDRVGSSASEQGLLGLAFHPEYASNGIFFVNYTDRNGDTVVSRFSVSGDPNRGDPASESLVLALAQPASNHNGGNVVFGPDGYLYIGTGDGGAAGDQFGNGQNGRTLLGAMLRLDVDNGLPYAIPPDNPFVDDPDVRDEIWAIGLRNPWRYTFDRLTGDLYIADVGQNIYEEINIQAADSPGGENYGWPIMEGLHCFPADSPCDQTGLILPIAEYDHSQGCSVTGGYVYRGAASPALYGVYLFGDYCSGRLWGLAPTPEGGWQVAALAQENLRISSFGEDEAGEVYLVDMSGGVLYRIGVE